MTRQAHSCAAWPVSVLACRFFSGQHPLVDCDHDVDLVWDMDLHSMGIPWAFRARGLQLHERHR